MEKRVDVAIIGAGTAGINALSEVRKVTENLVLINDGPLGTTCARVGCMPSKIMIQIGHDYQRRHFLAEEGISQATRLSIDIAQSMAHVRILRDNFVNGIIEDVIEPLGRRFIDGRAEFIEPTVLQVGSQKIVANAIVIATGSKPVMPPQWESFADYTFTTDTIFEQERFPRELAIIGLGAIGLELGQALKHMGLQVTGIDQLERIGGLQDPEVNRAAVDILEKEIPLILGAQARIDKAENRLRIEAGNQAFEVDKMLVSVGRTPNLEGLRLDRLGVALDDRGVPVFDCHTMQVADLPVFIAGDVNNYRPVLHEVAHEGTVAGYNAANQPNQRFKRKTPLAICFSNPNICIAGASWDDVKEGNPAVGSADFQGGREKIMLRPHGKIRIYADRQSGRILGSEMVAPQGEHLGHLLAWSIQRELTVHDLLAMPFYHPTVEETLKAALVDLLDQLDVDSTPLAGFETL